MKHLIDLVKETVSVRGASYGDPTLDFRRISEMLTGLFREKLQVGVHFTPQDVSKIMIVFKLSRSMNREDPDNVLDIMGYAHCWDLLLQSTPGWFSDDQ